MTYILVKEKDEYEVIEITGSCYGCYETREEADSAVEKAKSAKGYSYRGDRLAKSKDQSSERDKINKNTKMWYGLGAKK